MPTLFGNVFDLNARSAREISTWIVVWGFRRKMLSGVDWIGGLENLAWKQIVKFFILFSGKIRVAGKSSPHPLSMVNLIKRTVTLELRTM
jgi:hypothetical protein